MNTQVSALILQGRPGVGEAKSSGRDVSDVRAISFADQLTAKSGAKSGRAGIENRRTARVEGRADRREVSERKEAVKSGDAADETRRLSRAQDTEKTEPVVRKSSDPTAGKVRKGRESREAADELSFDTQGETGRAESGRGKAVAEVEEAQETVDEVDAAGVAEDETVPVDDAAVVAEVLVTPRELINSQELTGAQVDFSTGEGTSDQNAESQASGFAAIQGNGAASDSTDSDTSGGTGGSGADGGLSAQRRATYQSAKAEAAGDLTAGSGDPAEGAAGGHSGAKAGVTGTANQAGALAATTAAVEPGTTGLSSNSPGAASVSADPLSVLQSLAGGTQATHASAPQGTVATAQQVTPEARFAEVNSPAIVDVVRQQAFVTGAAGTGNGTMTLKLDPPEIGALQVAVTMKDGLATVSLQTDNPEAARLMTHTLSQLRDSLAAAGIVVDKLTVQQSPKSESSGDPKNGNSNGQGGSGGQGQASTWQQDDSQRREQQRKELLERMWRRVAGDDVNLVA